MDAEFVGSDLTTELGKHGWDQADIATSDSGSNFVEFFKDTTPADRPALQNHDIVSINNTLPVRFVDAIMHKYGYRRALPENDPIAAKYAHNSIIYDFDRSLPGGDRQRQYLYNSNGKIDPPMGSLSFGVATGVEFLQGEYRIHWANFREQASKFGIVDGIA